MICKKCVLRNFAKFRGKHLCQSLFLNKGAGLRHEALIQVFSSEFSEISKNTFYYRAPLAAASGIRPCCFHRKIEISIRVELSCSKNIVLFASMKTLSQNDEKCFFFHLKISFHSQDTSIFVLTFWPCRKNCLIRKLRLIFEFMTSQPGE